MDEEELNGLRANVREKDKQCRDYKARIGRKKQLELAKEWGMEEDGDAGDDGGKTPGKSAAKRKSVTFGGNSADEGKREMKDDDKLRNSSVTSKKPQKSLTKGVASDPPKTTHNVAANYEERKSASSSAQQMQKPSGNGTTQIPRKRKHVSSGSLLSLIPAKKAELRNTKGETEEPPLVDPSKARDRLRKELEEAEASEIAAVELRRKMFGSRIVSRTDVGDLGRDVKSLKRVFPCGGVMVRCVDSCRTPVAPIPHFAVVADIVPAGCNFGRSRRCVGKRQGRNRKTWRATR